MIHPRGQIELSLNFEAGYMRGRISLPAGITGAIRFAGNVVDIKSGTQSIEL